MVRFYKQISLLMAVVIFCCSVSLFSTPKTNAEVIKFGFIFESSVNIREDASTDSKSLDKVSELSVSVIESKEDLNSEINPATQTTYIWYKVTYTKSSTTVTGYVREDLIRISESVIDDDFDKQLSEFPESYHDALKELHAMYPNWQFMADKIQMTFNEAVAAEDVKFYKLVSTKYNSWRSMRKGCYDWSKKTFVETDSGGWYGASREVIAYYMDPRNFLNANDIYVYMKQSYDSKSQTVAGVEEIVKGTFLDAEITDKNDKYYGKRYAAVIRYAGSQSKVNAYVLASTILQEQGRDGSTLSKGTTYEKETEKKTVYNFFNFGASGSNKSEVLENGAEYAYEQEWFTPTDSIVNGAIKYGTNYISVGQDTYFYKNFNIIYPDNLWHQYAQNVADSLNSSKFLKNNYIENYEMKLVFRIPVYESLPKSVSKLPAKSDKLNNYYFSDIEAEGLTPTFNRYTYEYSMSVEGDTTINFKLPKGATYAGEETFTLKKGDNTLKLVIKSETGYKNTYKINTFSEKACTVTVKNVDDIIVEKPEEEKIVLGDTNGDGKITTSDLANVRLHLLELITLKDDNLKGADTNKDGKITTSDLANIRLHLLELITLK